MTDKDTIIAANAAFYAAFSAGTLQGLAAIWAEEEDISCIHPGWPAIVGRTAVIASWREILLNPARPHIICREPYAIVTGDSGYVLCVEIIGTMALAASNHFKRDRGIWRLVHHQASPIGQILNEPPSDTPPEPRQVH